MITRKTWKLLAILGTIVLLTGFSLGEGAENTDHGKLGTFETIVKGITSNLPSLDDIGLLAITSPDRGDFVAGETVELTAEVMCVSENVEGKPDSWSTSYRPGIWLEVTEPSGHTVYSEMIDEWGYVEAGSCYEWSGDWDIPSDIGGESGWYEFRMWIVEDNRDQFWCGDENAWEPTAGWDFEDCVQIISNFEYADFEIDAGKPEDHPPDARVEVLSTNIQVGEQTFFSASESTDDHGIIGFDWFVNGQLIEENSGESFDSVFDESGTHEVEVVAIDTSGQRSSDTTTIHVADEQNQPPVAIIEVSDTSPLTGQEVHFDAGESFDPDGEIINYEWSLDRSRESFHHVFQEPGSHTVELTVMDDQGATATDTIVIDVEPGQPEVDSLFISKSTVETGEHLTAEAVAFSPTGQSLEYSWSIEGETTQETGEKASFSFNNPGEKTITVDVDDGLNSVQESVTVDVVESGDDPDETLENGDEDELGPIQSFFFRIISIIGGIL